MTVPRPLDDAAAVAAVIAGDLAAFSVLVARYRDTYFRFAVRMLNSREDADDALQSAFVRAYRNIARCEDPSRFGAWLYQIVNNECRTFGTRRGRRELRLVRDEALLERTPAAADNPHDGMGEEIQRALQQLEPDQREAFILKYVEELSYDEMAGLTGAGVSALKMRVKRACERLRALLEGVHHE